MSIFYHNTENLRKDWESLKIVPLLATNIPCLGASDTILFHASDLFSQNRADWLKFKTYPEIKDTEIDELPTARMMFLLADKIKGENPPEIMLFTGGGWNQFQNNDNRNINNILLAAFDRLPDCIFLGPADVASDNGAVPAFGNFVTEYHQSGGNLRARDWFDPQLGELKSAFRLLTQVWLVGQNQMALEGVPANAAKRISKNTVFWKPATSVNAQKLTEALKREACLKSWTPQLPPKIADVPLLRKWCVMTDL